MNNTIKPVSTTIEQLLHVTSFVLRETFFQMVYCKNSSVPGHYFIIIWTLLSQYRQATPFLVQVPHSVWIQEGWICFPFSIIINCVLPNFIPPTFNTCIKSSKHLHFNIEGYFSNSTITIACPCTSFKD